MKFNNCLFLCLVILECLHHRHHAFSLDNQALTEENNDQETKTEDVEESTDAGGVEEVDCESQAKKGECQTNYDMWNTCTPNCVKHSKDTWKNCPTLAYNERCISRSLEMRRDMHINCPETCGYAIAWNFKHREFMKLDKFATVDTALGDEPCAPPRGILATADIMRDRLLLYISGGVDVVKGMNHAWIPDDFLVFYGLCEALLYTLRLYDTVFHHHKKHFGKSLHDHKHGHGHKHVDHKHHSNHKTNNIDQKDTVEERRYLLSITNKTTLNSRNLAATSKKISSERISNKKKDVKEAFNVDSKGNTKSTGGTTKSSKVFQKVDQKVSQYQAIIEEVNKAIETAENSDVYLVRQLAQWVYRMNTSSYHDFPYDLTQSCPTGPFPVKHDSSASKSTRILQDSETDSENDKAETESESEVEFEGDATEPAQVCQHCRHQDIQLKHLPDILGIKLNLAKFNVSSRSLSSRTVKLKNGVLVPRLGFGCGMLGSDSEAEEAMYNAIKAGYRHFDTAQGYSNEENLGRAMRRAMDEKLVTRKQMFIATKLTFCTQFEGYKGVKDAVSDQLNKLQTTYIDMYMFHCYIADPNKLSDMWRAIEDLYKEGKLKSIGHGNIPEKELKRFYDRAKVKPMFSQDKVDLYHIGRTRDTDGEDLVAQARNYKMKIVAFSPLSAWPFVMKPTYDPIVLNVAHRLQITPGQVVLKWLMQLDFIPLTRSTTVEHLQENLKVFKISALSDSDMRLLACLSYLISNPFHRYVPL